MFKITIENYVTTSIVEDKLAGEDLSLDDALDLIEQALKGFGYYWDGNFGITRQEDTNVSNESVENEYKDLA